MDAQGTIKRITRRTYNIVGQTMAFRSPANSKAVTIMAVDRSAAAILDEKTLKIGVLKPCCTVLSADLAALNIPPATMVDVVVTFGGKMLRILSVHDKPDPSFRVLNNALKPVPNWGELGEILFMLMEV